jgi:hypothetical protein
MDTGLTELLGYAAAGLVLATFCMRDMTALRCMAIASNLAFIAYGTLAGLGPVLLLHLLLLPVNVLRLVDAGRRTRRDAAADATSRRRKPVSQLTPLRPGCAPSPWTCRARGRRAPAHRQAPRLRSYSRPRRSTA